MSADGKMKVYYNSACPVCRAGIEESQCRLREQGVDTVEWVDVHTAPERVQEVSEQLEKVRERLHVRDEDGRLHVGADAIAELMAHTRGRHWSARLLRSLVVKPMAEFSYNCFARGLYIWNRALKHW